MPFTSIAFADFSATAGTSYAVTETTNPAVSESGTGLWALGQYDTDAFSFALDASSAVVTGASSLTRDRDQFAKMVNLQALYNIGDAKLGVFGGRGLFNNTDSFEQFGVISQFDAGVIDMGFKIGKIVSTQNDSDIGTFGLSSGVELGASSRVTMDLFYNEFIDSQNKTLGAKAVVEFDIAHSLTASAQYGYEQSSNDSDLLSENSEFNLGLSYQFGKGNDTTLDAIGLPF